MENFSAVAQNTNDPVSLKDASVKQTSVNGIPSAFMLVNLVVLIQSISRSSLYQFEQSDGVVYISSSRLWMDLPHCLCRNIDQVLLLLIKYYPLQNIGKIHDSIINEIIRVFAAIWYNIVSRRTFSMFCALNTLKIDDIVVGRMLRWFDQNSQLEHTKKIHWYPNLCLWKKLTKQMPCLWD
jgi:hypothetical protein